VEKTQELGLVIVRKGAHTSISGPDGSLYFNSSGNAGMAKGGSGDVLTGVIVSLLAQGLGAMEAAKTGVFFHGKAGDDLKGLKGERSMLASELADHLFRP
jgi:NAD(P)H-hydrate epimerase